MTDINYLSGATQLISASEQGPPGPTGPMGPVGRMTEVPLNSGSSNEVALEDGDVVVVWNSPTGTEKNTTIPTSSGSLQQILVIDKYGDAADDIPIVITSVDEAFTVTISTAGGYVFLIDLSSGWTIRG